MTYNIIQLNENKRLQYNDLRYRYLKSFGSVNKGEIKFLERVFNDNAKECDYEKGVKKLLDYEFNVKETAAKI